MFQQFSFTCLHSIPTWESWCFLCIYILKIPFCSVVTVPFTWVASPFSSPAPYQPRPLPRGWVGQGIILSALGLGHRRHLISPQLLSSCKWIKYHSQLPSVTRTSSAFFDWSPEPPEGNRVAGSFRKVHTLSGCCIGCLPPSRCSFFCLLLSSPKLFFFFFFNFLYQLSPGYFSFALQLSLHPFSTCSVSWEADLGRLHHHCILRKLEERNVQGVIPCRLLPTNLKLLLKDSLLERQVSQASGNL